MINLKRGLIRTWVVIAVTWIGLDGVARIHVHVLEVGLHPHRR
jgi:hypothetical protein